MACLCCTGSAVAAASSAWGLMVWVVNAASASGFMVIVVKELCFCGVWRSLVSLELRSRDLPGFRWLGCGLRLGKRSCDLLQTVQLFVCQTVALLLHSDPFFFCECNRQRRHSSNSLLRQDKREKAPSRDRTGASRLMPIHIECFRLFRRLPH